MDCTSLLKYVYGQLYNGKLAHRYGHAPTDECPLCHRPDSCTHIAGECEAAKKPYHQPPQRGVSVGTHSNTRLRKRRGALYNANEQVLVVADAGTHPQTTEEDLEGLSFSSQDDNAPTRGISSAA